MPTNPEILASFDANALIRAARIFTEDATREHAAQCIAFESLRGLLDSGMTTDEYNTMSGEAWNAHVAASVIRAGAYAQTGLLNTGEQDSACNYGGNYFERTYDVVMEAVQGNDEVSFRKSSPLGLVFPG